METSDATKILGKGPEYLRKQMELENEAKEGMSAVERLAASKPKYVKSQQVVHSTQEPIISLGSASVSSTGSSNRSSNRGGKVIKIFNSPGAPVGGKNCSPGQVRRSSSKKRPDSLLLYRQKCELLRGSAHERKHQITQKLLLSAINKRVALPEITDKERESGGIGKNAATSDSSSKENISIVLHPSPWKQTTEDTTNSTKTGDSGEKGTSDGVKTSASFLKVPACHLRSGKKVGRSHSDISSRYSKSFADFDSFFKYCGLDGEVIESLGKENFSARSDEIAINVRSVSVSTSDEGFSRKSGDSDGLIEDDLHQKTQQGTSVIERNARIIKWLYSCKNAKETGKKLRDLD